MERNMSAPDTWQPQSRHCVNTNQQMYESEMSARCHCLCGDHFCCSFGAKQHCQDLSVNDQSSLSHANDTNMFMHYLSKNLKMNDELADQQLYVWMTMEKKAPSEFLFVVIQ